MSASTARAPLHVAPLSLSLETPVTVAASAPRAPLPARGLGTSIGVLDETL